MIEERRRCSAITKRGTLCGVWALKGEDCCLFHSRSEKAREWRRKANELTSGRFITRKELLRQLSRDFRALADRTDDTSRRERQRLGSLIHELLKEREELYKIKRLAKEKGLL